MQAFSVALLQVVALTALALTVSAGTSGSECVPLLRDNNQDPLMLSPIAGPSNNHFDLANGTYTESEFSSVSGALPSSSVEPTHTSGVNSEPTPTGEAAVTEGSSSAGDETLKERAPPTVDEVKAELEADNDCIPSGHSCLIEALKPPKVCCSHFCVAAIIGFAGWCK